MKYTVPRLSYPTWLISLLQVEKYSENPLVALYCALNIKALRTYTHRLIGIVKSEPQAKTEARHQDLSSENLELLWQFAQKYTVVFWQTQKYLHIHKAHKQQLWDGARQGLCTDLCTAAAGISRTIRKEKKARQFWVMGISYRPSHSQNSSQQLSGAGWREGSGEITKPPVCPVFLLSLYTLPDQRYHLHYTKSSNDCTKMKAIMWSTKKKSKAKQSNP